jgi:hypothetical protein
VRRLNLAPPQQMYDRLVAGGIAGAVSRTLVAPLERYAGFNAPRLHIRMVPLSASRQFV